MKKPLSSVPLDVSLDQNVAEGQILIFEKDHTPYHVKLIEKGVYQYFKSTASSLSILPFGLGELKILLGADELKKVAVLGWFQDASSLAFFQKNEIPYLNLQEGLNRTNTPIDIRFEGEGRIAADYFIKELNLEYLGFSGLEKSESSDRRLSEFRDQCSRYGRSVHSVFQRSGNCLSFALKGEERLEFATERRRQLTDFLMSIAKPAGIFCANDAMACHLTYFARQLGFSVPDEICILGVGGRHDTEEDGVHSISIILLDHVKQGYLAAELMEKYLNQGISKTVRIEPSGIVHRKTTTRRMIKDPLVQEAMTRIQQDAEMTIASLCQDLEVSRRTLETRFRSATNMTIGKAIDYERFNRAKVLMTQFGYNKESIAALAGYKSRDQMWRSFRRFAHMSPREYSRSKRQ